MCQQLLFLEVSTHKVAQIVKAAVFCPVSSVAGKQILLRALNWVFTDKCQ